jgi:diaminopimelate decarboxylase
LSLVYALSRFKTHKNFELLNKKKMETIESIIKESTYGSNEEAFFVFNIEDLIIKHKKWIEFLPRVIPHYAVKCNNLPLILDILAGLGLSFDCSSRVLTINKPLYLF